MCEAPLNPGKYQIKLDLVLEQVCWFEERGSHAIKIDLEVSDTVPDSRVPGLLRARIEALAEPDCELRPGSRVQLPLRIRNCGNTRWLHESGRDVGRVTIGAHLLSQEGELLEHDFLHQALLGDLQPGETLEADLGVVLPNRPGAYVLEVDMVDEGISWFGRRGSTTLRVPIRVSADTP